MRVFEPNISLMPALTLLLQLIVILGTARVGLDAGLIGAELFTMLLVMALVTTAMTGPLTTLYSLGR
jgi:hypothetical protein